MRRHPRNPLAASVDFSPVQTDPDGAFSCAIISPAVPGQTSLDSLCHDARIICLDGEAAVDVVVTPGELEPGTWMLTDRLGRSLGTVAEASPSLFVLNADRHSELSRMRTTDFPSLNEAMSAIAKHMKGECQLSSGNG